jgi:hypothetical protein
MNFRVLKPGEGTLEPFSGLASISPWNSVGSRKSQTTISR